MKLRAKTALRAATGLATLAVALHSSQAFAAPDPFALPQDADRSVRDDPFALPDTQLARVPDTTGYTFFAEVVLNGERLKGIAPLRRTGSKLAIQSAFAFSAGIVRVLPPQDFIDLDTIPGAKYDFDTSSYTLTIRIPLHSTGANMVSLSGRPERGRQSGSDVAALILDYDLSAQVDQTGVAASGLVAPRLVKGNVSFDTAWRFATSGDRLNQGVTRLDTALTVRNPDAVASTTVGDFINQAPAGSRAVRMLGLRFGTDFSLRPDLVTQPLPDFVDSVAVPTGLDVLVNDRRVANVDIQPGEFTVRNIPVPVGRSEVGVVVRDALGREVVRTIQFYGSRDLLAPGLSEGAFNIGAIRRRYGLVSNDYGPVAISAMLRKGFSPRFTGTVMGEATETVMNLGAAGDAVIGNFGILSATLRASRAALHGDDTLAGTMMQVGFQSVGPAVSYSIEYRTVSTHYADVASANGDAQPPSLLAANISFDLKEFGRLRFAAIEQKQREAGEFAGPRRTTRLVSANYRRELHRRVDLSLDASYRRDGFGRSDFTILAGLSISLGGAQFGQVSYSHGRDDEFLQSGLYAPETGPGKTGYSVTAGTGTVDRLGMSVSRQEHWSRFEAQGEVVGGSAAARIGMRGSLIAADGEIFASRGMGDTYILVDAGGVDDIVVERENRVAGRTGRGGRLLIDEVPGYNTIKVGVNPAELPPDVIASSVEEYVAAAPRSVAKVRLGLTHYIPEVMRLSDPQRGLFPAGTQVVALPSGTEYLVGYDGELEINLALKDTELEIREPNGSICLADLADRAASDTGAVPELRCYMRSRTYVVGGPDDIRHQRTPAVKALSTPARSPRKQLSNDPRRADDTTDAAGPWRISESEQRGFYGPVCTDSR
ncbi:fimbria/pilus outer membrane usher protein [Qipengyuania sp. CAU 1752]